jgi:HD superfamily phosphodiesterase
MVTPEQLYEISLFVRDYLLRTATTSDQDWVKRFPRAAEHRWHHTLNVLRNAETILAGEKASDDAGQVVRVAVYLHDVSMFVCDHEVHGQVSAQIAEDYLAKMNLPRDFVARVKRAVAEHGTDLGPLPPAQQGALFSWEGKVLLEADILDKLGASAIADALLALGGQGGLPHEAPSAISGGRAMERAVVFKDYIWTATGRSLAKRRFAFFLEFLDRLREEMHDPDFEAAA